VVLATRHKQFLEKNDRDWSHFFTPNTLVVDTFNILNDQKIITLLKKGVEVIGVGKGHIQRLKNNL